VSDTASGDDAAHPAAATKAHAEQLDMPPTAASPAPPQAVGDAPSPSRERRPASDTVPAVPDDDGTSQELAFVHRIQAALVADAPTKALAMCAEHEQRWPHGTFVQEREGLRAIAACQAGSRDAVELAHGFFSKFPRAPLTGRVRDACIKKRKNASF
jgi:hypothetical protein